MSGFGGGAPVLNSRQIAATKQKALNMISTKRSSGSGLHGLATSS
jgi:hypothetical protein